MNWDYPNTTIGDIAKVKGGKRLPKGFLVQDETTAHPYIRVVDFTLDGLDPTNIKYIDDHVYRRISRYTITSDDVYISIAGTIGLVGVVPKYLSGANLTENAAKICAIDPSIDKRFMMYYLRSPFGRAQVAARTGGTSQPKLALFRIEQIEIPLLPLPTQRKIAAILSAYDHLIENNTRRIAILEQMARLLYREWFVHFRFPGHHQAQLVDSPLGPIPEGWQPVTVRDVSSYINRGVSPTYADKSPSLVINQKCIRDSRLNLEHARTHTSRVPSDKYVRFGDVLINSTGIGTLGRVAQVYRTLDDCTVDSHVSIVRPNEKVGVDYYGFYLFSLQPYFDSQGTGSTGQTELAREMIGKASFLLPPSNPQDHFGVTVAPMRTCCETLAITNSNLRRTRDLLLPRLISGEIDVSDLDIDTGEFKP